LTEPDPPLHGQQHPGDPPPEKAVSPLSARDRELVEGPIAPSPAQAPESWTEAPKTGELRVGTCQFPVSRSIRRNADRILAQIERAAVLGARVVQFPESALSGYLGRDYADRAELNFEALASASAQICAAAAAHRVWVLLGSAHPLGGGRRPHNSVYVIDDRGELVDRYDKRFCTTNDLEHYTPGNHSVLFEVDGVRCGIAICFDIRFPEIYRAYKASGVHCIFQCNYDARGEGRTHFRHIMRQTMQTRCATNALWMSATNSSAHYQSYPSVFIRPDGRIAERLRDHRAGLMVNSVLRDADLYDAAGPHRDRALQGAPGNGEPFFDRRSLNRQAW